MVTLNHINYKFLLFFKMTYKRKDKPGDYSVFDAGATLMPRVSSFTPEKTDSSDWQKKDEIHGSFRFQINNPHTC